MLQAKVGREIVSLHKVLHQPGLQCRGDERRTVPVHGGRGSVLQQRDWARRRAAGRYRVRARGI